LGYGLDSLFEHRVVVSVGQEIAVIQHIDPDLPVGDHPGTRRGGSYKSHNRERATISNTKTIAITIEENILERIDQLAASGDGSGNRSRIIREAVREYLTRTDLLAEETREREIFRRNRTKLAKQAAALVKEQAKP